MPRGDKSEHSDQPKRQAEDIQERERKQGRSEEAAERIEWATFNKQAGRAAGGQNLRRKVS